MPEVHEKRPGKSGTVYSMDYYACLVYHIHTFCSLFGMTIPQVLLLNAKTFPITKRID